MSSKSMAPKEVRKSACRTKVARHNWFLRDQQKWARVPSRFLPFGHPRRCLPAHVAGLGLRPVPTLVEGGERIARAALLGMVAVPRVGTNRIPQVTCISPCDNICTLTIFKSATPSPAARWK